jgi:uncharacterized MAPEG superfamily protein
MTRDLVCLVVLALWTLPLNYMGSIGRMWVAGTLWGWSNRDVVVEPPPWSARGERAQRNHLENLPMFMVLVLVLHLTGKHDDVTALACMAFVVARMAHGVLYVAGVLYARTLAYWASLACLAVLLSRLF